MPTYAVGGITTLAQKFISKSVASQGYAKSAVLYLLEGLSSRSNGDPLMIGRPNEGAVLSGFPVDNVETLTLPNQNQYVQRIQGFKTSNTSVIAARGNMNQVASPTTLSQGQATQFGAQFNFMWKLQTPLEIWEFDTDMAMQSASAEGMGVAAAQLINEATSVGTEEHLDQLAARLIYGSPTNQFSNPNDDFQGLILAGTANNTYGQTDRSQLATNDPWQPVTVTTAFPKDIYTIIQNANVTQKMNVFGGGINVVLCGGDNYLIFKNQILARTKDAGMVGGGAGLPAMAKMGVTREVLRADNVYVMHEPFLDTCYATTPGTTTPLYTAQPNTVIVANLKLFRFVIKPKYNMRVRPFVDISDKSIGAPAAMTSFIETCALLACQRPSVAIGLYTNLV